MSLPGAQDDLDLLAQAALAAGDIARRHFGTGPATWDKGGGQGPVTEADLEIDAMLRARLLAARPGYGWLSEETEDDAARLAAQRVFIVDPIDGTRAFIDGQKGFAHALAVAEEGRVIAALVHLPLLDLTYSARAGGGAWLNGQPLPRLPAGEDGVRLEGARLLASRRQMAPELWRAGAVPEVARHFRTSIAWRLCLVAEGAFDATLAPHDTWEWDTAAATLIATEAGARVTDRLGAGLMFNRPHPASRGLLAAAPGLHAGLLARLA
jgi:myo-inositol-1(or 4)-monophosphatase